MDTHPTHGAAAGRFVDIAGTANRRIWDFVHQPDNLSLRPGTGYYSALFRGGLFGEVQAAKVAEQLSTRTVDLLWFGTNPCVPRSLDNIIDPPVGTGDFPSFKRQIESGFFGSSRWTPTGEPEADFNPIETPTGGWTLYRDLFERVANLECVAMANFIPWGSQDTTALVTRLGTVNRPLLQRVLEFSDDLNTELVQALRPKLVVVPFSLGRNQRLNAVGPIGLSLKQATDARAHVLRLTEGAFNFYTAICQRGTLGVRTAFVRHPSSLRLSTESKRRVVSEVAQTLRELQ